MSFVDSERAGKRLVVWTDANGGATRLRPLPPQKDKQEYDSAIAGGKIIFAGEAVKKGYLTYQELKQMFPRFTPEQLVAAGVTSTRVTSVRRNHTKMSEQTFITRWGLTDETYPRWQALSDHGKTREHTKSYTQVEERRTTFQVAIGSDEKEMLMSCSGQVCVPYQPRIQDLVSD